MANYDPPPYALEDMNKGQTPYPQSQPYGQPQPYGQSQPYPQNQPYGQPQPQYQPYAQQQYQPKGETMNQNYEQQQPPTYSNSPLPPYTPNIDGKLIVDQPTVKPKWNDVWATILFLIHLGGFVALSYFALKGVRVGTPYFTPHDEAHFVYALIICIFWSSFLGGLAFIGMKKAPKSMIIAAIIFNAAILIAYAIFAFVWLRSTSYGIILIIFAVLQLFIYYLWRRRLDFAALMLKTVAEIMGQYPATIFHSIVMMAFQIAWAIYFTFVLVAVTSVWQDGARIGISIYCFFSYYWTSQVIKNIAHVTNGGLFACYYFLSGTEFFPKNPTWGSFKRAMTFSFGSICFGSLLVALIKTLRYIILSLVKNNYARCLLNCIIGFFDSMLRLFNHYAYTEIAIYGEDYCTSAKRTWEMFKRNGFDVIISDDLIGNVLSSLVFTSGIVAFGIGFAYCYTVFDDRNASLIVAFSGLIIAGMITIAWTDVIESGSSATMVSLSENPQVLIRTKPELYNQIKATYQTIV